MILDREPVTQQEPITKLGVLIPDGKHIYPETIRLLKNRGVQIGAMRDNGALHAEVDNAPVALTTTPTGNVIEQVADGIFFQLGFIGSDMLAEYRASLSETAIPRVEELLSFEVFPRNLRISLLVRNNPTDNEVFKGVADLRNRRVVTSSFPELTRQFLQPYFPDRKKVPVNIDSKIDGKEEGLVSARAADAAVVLVESGKTMRSNTLRILGGEEEGVMMRDIKLALVYNPEIIKERGHESLVGQFSDRLQNGRRHHGRIFSALFGMQTLLAFKQFKVS